MNVDSRLPLSLLMIGIGLAMVVGTGTATYVLQMTLAEPVEAEVVSSDVESVACSVDAGCDVEYVPVVTYQYTYDGEAYTSDRVYPEAAEHRSIGRDSAASTASEYASGDQVTAHVLPVRPGTAYLVSNTPGIGSAIFGVLGALLALAGANGIQQSLRGVEPPDAIG